MPLSQTLCAAHFWWIETSANRFKSVQIRTNDLYMFLWYKNVEHQHTKYRFGVFDCCTTHLYQSIFADLKRFGSICLCLSSPVIGRQHNSPSLLQVYVYRYLQREETLLNSHGIRPLRVYTGIYPSTCAALRKRRSRYVHLHTQKVLLFWLILYIPVYTCLCICWDLLWLYSKPYLWSTCTGTCTSTVLQ